jgi:mono/diheme cytochrome c family protein
MMRSRAAYFPFTLFILILLALVTTSAVSGQGTNENNPKLAVASPDVSGQSAKERNPAAKKQVATQSKADGLAAWQQVYSVLTHPRCINCHTATNYPQQGDDRHRHLVNVVRGPEGKGVPGLNCATCHQGANADSTGVPGAHDWHLAPLAMKWQDTNDKILSSSAVCKIVIDPKKNNGRDGAGILKHHTEEPLVLWGFAPGRRNDGTMRALPPLTHAQFVEATRRWVEAGTPCP